MKSTKATLAKNIVRKWHKIDASKQNMGRVATQIAIWLRGKHKRDYTPNMDMGDFVVAINTNHLKFSGRKTEQKVYFRHSGYLGGIKSEKLNVVLQKDPSEALRRAVFSMLDDVKFRKAMMARLKLVGNSEHNYQV
jgi:large subunit ribosomal protein L13